MGYKIVFSELAENDLFDIYYYIAINDSFERADKIRIKLISFINTLEELPKRGRKVKESHDAYPELMEVILKPFRIIYEITGKDVLVHAVLDGRREIQDILRSRFLR